MNNVTPQQIGMRLNKLRRYKLILDLYNQHKTEDIPLVVVWRKYIYPVYPISRSTLYEILGTAVVKELAKVEAEKGQLTLF
ncbi:Uncharacterised protein [Myroides odoratimimus]|uniref:hypothetical protein n=1 Tax=Myroides odoratimimus TaxID=76832 RepID=UPI000840CEAA|nr:hypothetical protein [Myroides odoratimimus]STZ48149.1 Uncharacterised protein [Myroides odoratimimus]